MSLDQKRYVMRERKSSGSQENPTVTPQKIAKNEKTPVKRVLSTRNVVKSEEKSQQKVDRQVFVDSLLSPSHVRNFDSVMSTTSKQLRGPPFSPVTTRSKATKNTKKSNKISKLSLRGKDKKTLPRNQTQITNYFQKSPSSQKFQPAAASSSVTVQETPPVNATLKRKTQQEVAEVQAKVHKTPVKSECKENVCATKKSRKKKVKNSKEAARLNRESFEEMKQEFSDTHGDGAKKDLVAEQMEEMMPYIRSPIKFSTPRPDINIKEEEDEEQEDLSAYELPADDPMYSQFLEDCKTLEAAFASGLVSTVDRNLAKRMLDINMAYLDDVNCGKVKSHLLEAFQVDVDQGHRMNYTDGCIIFSSDNLKLFVQQIGAHFSKNDDDVYMKKLNFYLKVLMPELIAKIVMSVYKISKKKAFNKMVDIGIHVTNVDNCF